MSKPGVPSRIPFPSLRTLAIGFCLSAALRAQTEPLGPGATFETLAAGKSVFHGVTVKSVSARSLMIAHSSGMTSLRLRDLSPALQARFGYDPARDAASEAELSQATSSLQQRQAAATQRLAAAAKHDSPVERILQAFGQAPEVRTVVDLRPNFRQLELGVKNQGRRPSCSVFAVISALEYQNAGLTGQPEKLSEEYLTWATRKTIRRSLPEIAAPDAGTDADTADRLENSDAGFSLSEVVTALRAYGVPPQSSMPNTFGKKITEIAPPPDDVVAEARNRRRVFIHPIPGRDGVARIANTVQALNEGVPVVLGLRWPHYRTIRAGFLGEQQPILDYAHAVTLVGYRSASGRLEDAVFLFKNSYGAQWGMGGYGEVTYAYLARHLLSAVVLEVQAEKQD